MALPNTYTDKNETGCCPVPNIQVWDKNRIIFDNKPFVRMYTKNFMHVPINMSSIMTKLHNLVHDNKAELSAEQAMILSRDISPWKAEQLYAVSKPIDGADNVNLSGMFLTKVFEGPFEDVKKWYDKTIKYVKSKGYETKKIYFFYTTCPKCARHYGKNYVIALAEI